MLKYVFGNRSNASTVWSRSSAGLSHQPSPGIVTRAALLTPSLSKQVQDFSSDEPGTGALSPTSQHSTDLKYLTHKLAEQVTLVLQMREIQERQSSTVGTPQPADEPHTVQEKLDRIMQVCSLYMNDSDVNIEELERAAQLKHKLDLQSSRLTRTIDFLFKHIHTQLVHQNILHDSKLAQVNPLQSTKLNHLDSQSTYDQDSLLSMHGSSSSLALTNISLGSLSAESLAPCEQPSSSEELNDMATLTKQLRECLFETHHHLTTSQPKNALAPLHYALKIAKQVEVTWVQDRDEFLRQLDSLKESNNSLQQSDESKLEELNNLKAKLETIEQIPVLKQEKETLQKHLDDTRDLIDKFLDEVYEHLRMRPRASCHLASDFEELHSAWRERILLSMDQLDDRLSVLHSDSRLLCHSYELLLSQQHQVSHRQFSHLEQRYYSLQEQLWSLEQNLDKVSSEKQDALQRLERLTSEREQSQSLCKRLEIGMRDVQLFLDKSLQDTEEGTTLRTLNRNAYVEWSYRMDRLADLWQLLMNAIGQSSTLNSDTASTTKEFWMWMAQRLKGDTPPVSGLDKSPLKRLDADPVEDSIALKLKKIAREASNLKVRMHLDQSNKE